MRNALIILLWAGIPFCGNPLWGQTPSPGESKTSHEPKQQREPATPQANVRGTAGSPISVEVLDRPKSKEQAEKERTEENYKKRIDGGTLLIAGVVAAFTGLLVWVGHRGVRAANRTLVAIEKQADLMERQAKEARESATQQARDVQASIAEATRASKAMEEIAESMASNVESVRQSVSINREIADRQKLISELQGRAYLTIVFDSVVPQNNATKVRFEPRIQVQNRGNTPAYDIRFSVVADVFAFPIPDEFGFPLPDELRGHSSTIGPGLHKIISAVVPKLYPEPEAVKIANRDGQCILAWGVVKYKDAFSIERFIEFGFTVILVGENQWMSQDTTNNNDSN